MDTRAPECENAREIPADGGIDLIAALKRLGNDEPLLRDMARIFVEDAPGLLEQAQCVRSGDGVEAARRAAHSLKGLAANFSDRAADAAQSAELALRSGDASEIARALAVLRMYVDRLIDGLRRSVLS